LQFKYLLGLALLVLVNEILAFAACPVIWGDFCEAHDVGFGDTSDCVALGTLYGQSLPLDIQHGDRDGVGSAVII
jgi:hypothetical protein